jgi:hypothetical protein
MNVPNRDVVLNAMKEYRQEITSALKSFEEFWRTQGKIASIETICEWVVKSSLLIEDFLVIQEEINNFLDKGSEEEKNHLAITEDFETLYYELMTETQRFMECYMSRKATRY